MDRPASRSYYPDSLAIPGASRCPPQIVVRYPTMPDPADTTVVSLLRDELLLINNALNEVCNGVDFDDAEFATRLGASREEALQLLEKVKILLRRKVG